MFAFIKKIITCFIRLPIALSVGMSIAWYPMSDSLRADTIPVAQFTVDQISGESPLTVNFSDLSVGEIDNWQWDFNGDTLIDSTEREPTHVYDVEGVYTVTLTVSNVSGSDIETKTDYITVTAAPDPNSDNNFTRGTETSKQYGIHEITLIGNGSVTNPFDTDCQVTFTPSSGALNAITVKAFYDGGDTWRAILYISETGQWQWQASSTNDPILDNQQGAFESIPSTLRGKLKKHHNNDYQWETAGGQTFLNLNDVGYILFNPYISDEDFQQFINDSWDRGITSVRIGGCGGYREWAPENKTPPRSNWCWDGPVHKDRFNIAQFQKTHERLEWLLNNKPDMYVQLIMFGKPRTGDWTGIPQEDRELTIDYLIARWAAWPQVFFQIANDIEHTYGDDADEHLIFYREIGRYLYDHDPWDNLRSAGSKRRELNQLTTSEDLIWHNYIHQERYSQLDAEVIDGFSPYPVHTFLGEDWYEDFTGDTGVSITDPAYYYRRLFWSALLSGGSPAYGGYYQDIIPYSESSYTGLDDIEFIKEFIEINNLDLAEFTPDDDNVKMRDDQIVGEGGNNGPSRVQCSRKGDNEFIIYHPNATDGELLIDYSPELIDPGSRIAETSSASISRIQATPDTAKTPGLQVNLSGEASGKEYSVTWYRVTNGEYADGGSISGIGWTLLDSPWLGEDVLLYLKEILPPCFSDFNDDKIVDADDLDIFTSSIGISDCSTGAPHCIGDTDSDDDVDSVDLSVLISEFGRTDCQ